LLRDSTSGATWVFGQNHHRSDKWPQTVILMSTSNKRKHRDKPLKRVNLKARKQFAPEVYDCLQRAIHYHFYVEERQTFEKILEQVCSLPPSESGQLLISYIQERLDLDTALDWSDKRRALEYIAHMLKYPSRWMRSLLFQDALFDMRISRLNPKLNDPEILYRAIIKRAGYSLRQKRDSILNRHCWNMIQRLAPLQTPHRFVYGGNFRIPTNQLQHVTSLDDCGNVLDHSPTVVRLSIDNGPRQCYMKLDSHDTYVMSFKFNAAGDFNISLISYSACICHHLIFKTNYYFREARRLIHDEWSYRVLMVDAFLNLPFPISRLIGIYMMNEPDDEIEKRLELVKQKKRNTFLQ
jgi:hypothetical protein